tara:strand:+ start:226045 stop:228636 length:2592 start_codon:yes stop_codon:yes gene_type:complete
LEILNRHIVCLVLLFFVALPNFSQQAETDSIYTKLDVYLEQPSSQHTKKLKAYLETISTTEKSVQLAKTIAYCNMGYVAFKNGMLQNAIDYYETAKQLYFSKKLSGYDITEYCLKPLGNLYIKTRALSEAENTIKHYLVLAQEKGQAKQEVSAILNLSVLYHNRGAYKKAIQLLRQGIEKAPNYPDLKLNLATNYFGLGQVEEAKKIVLKLIATSKNSSTYHLLAQIYRSEQAYDKAILALQHALTIAEQSRSIGSRERAKLHLALAETYFESNDSQNTILELQKVYSLLLPSYKTAQERPNAEQLYAETTLMDALDLHASTLTRTDNPRKAIETFEMAFTVNNYLFAQLYVQDSKIMTQQNSKRRAEQMLNLLYTQYQDTKDTSWIEKAIQLDNRIKGWVVFEAVTLKNKLGEQANEFQKLQEKLSVVNNQINKLSDPSNPDYKKLVSLQKTYSSLLTHQRKVYDSMQVKHAKNQDFDTTMVKKLRQKASTTGKMLVSYFLGEETGFQFIVSEEKISFKKLISSKKEYQNFLTFIREYNRFFNTPATINNDISVFTTASHTLFNKLKIPKSEGLLIIPDGLLSFVPFQTLLTKTTQSKQYSDMAFLVFESSISYAVSFQQYVNNNKGFTEKQSVLGVFPVFTDTPQELHYSVMEAEEIGNLFPSKILMRDQATAQSFLDAAKSHSILHISTHALGGSFTNEPDIQFIDSSFSLEELYGLQFSQQLVVLSACDTGVGKVVKGEGALSLARGFQYAGAPNVLFSLWQVNDKSTAQLIENYYKHLKNTGSRDISLHKASLDYLNNENIANPQKSPYYWGAFVYYGTTDLAQEPTQTYWYIFVIAGILIVGILFWFLNRRTYKNTK